ncbi:LmeA family phospholipid-binding protein [Streptomyces sp. NPDC001930]|uniref:LmeA family phospholipid-binding protein n=1 Tax=Streptomyces sp. NPDC001930 TaxID=3364625 RepID=UPI0036CB3ED4
MPLRTPHAPASPPAPERRNVRRGRTGRPSRPYRRTAAVTVLVGALLLTADALARQLGEERFADRIAARQGGGLTSPGVTIDGHPFLLHAARGHHPEVRVTGDARTPDGIPVRAEVDLHRVSEQPGGYAADSVDAAFTAPFDALGTAGDREMRLSDAGGGRLRIESGVLGMPLVITAEPRLDAGVVTLHADSATLAGRTLDPTAPAIAGALSRGHRQLPPLPLGLRPTEVTVGPDGITAHAEARRVNLT